MKAKNGRVCGFCHKSGHNVRSCAAKKAAEKGGQVESTASVPTSTSLALADHGVDISPGAAHQPIEFEEAVKQVVVNGTSLRLSMREFDGGMADLTMRVQKEKAQEVRLDIDVATKMYELLGWALQRQAARANNKIGILPPKTSNGLKVAATP